jgi:twitching motility protein PilT
MGGISYHVDLALNLLNAGSVFNVTLMEGNKVMLETTQDGQPVTVSCQDFVANNKGKFSDAEVLFSTSTESAVTRDQMFELANWVLGKSWDHAIGANALHGTLEIGVRNPLRCSFFLFSTGGSKRSSTPASEMQKFPSGYAGRLGCAMRILPTAPKDLAELGIHQRAKSVADVKGGLVLVVGSPGVGKSTTAAAFVEHVNRTRSGSIVTAESPIEVPFVSKKSVVSQREVGVNVASVALALRDAERNFAHTAFIGEIQTRTDELETFAAARHGMFVVATTFGNSATDAVKTLTAAVDSQGADGADLVATTLLAVIYQVRLPSTRNGEWEFAYESLVVHDEEEVAELIRTRNWVGLQNYVSDRQEISLNGSLAQLVRTSRILREHALVQSYDKKDIAQKTERAVA